MLPHSARCSVQLRAMFPDETVPRGLCTRQHPCIVYGIRLIDFPLFSTSRIVRKIMYCMLFVFAPYFRLSSPSIAQKMSIQTRCQSRPDYRRCPAGVFCTFRSRFFFFFFFAPSTGHGKRAEDNPIRSFSGGQSTRPDFPTALHMCVSNGLVFFAGATTQICTDGTSRSSAR